MIEVVKDNPCTNCGIKGLYENCDEKCVQYRKWYQYQQGRADAIEEFAKKLKSLDRPHTKYLVSSFLRDVYFVAEQLKEQKND